MEDDRIASNWKEFEGKKKYLRINAIGDPPESVDGRREPHFGTSQEPSVAMDDDENNSIGREF
jgi:hypothetical protein